jgi:hypothetical protein
MRLLKLRDDELSQAEFFGSGTPPYAILSHTWGADHEEVTLRDIVDGVGKSKAGYRKIQFCEKQAARDGLQYFWIDTCCIDKSSSAELSEAINSMFHWYQDAAKCYVYLSDVSVSAFDGDGEIPQRLKQTFMQSRWFTRGWTLQELIAPAFVDFFSAEGIQLGDKQSLEQTLHEMTGIPIQALQGSLLSRFSVDERMSWAANRMTKREEDYAYSLLGIFDVNMPLLYGEGRFKALKRLRKEIKESSGDESPALRTLSSKRKNSSQPQEGTTPMRKRHEMGATSHQDERSRHGSYKTEKSYPLTLSAELENASPLDQYELQPQVSKAESSATMSPRALYPNSLADLGFRIFILDPGVIGSKITGSIQEFNLLDPPVYNALSYVWGQEPAIHRVFLNNEATFIRPNLFHALQRIRQRTGHLRIWVDSLCINQFDDLERSAQVRLMATIYRKASSVLIWLGEEDSTSTFAMEFVPKLVRSDFQWDGSWWEQYGFITLARILERPWFRRGWVLQEAAFSTNSTIYCGDRQVHMDNFVMAIDLVRARLSSILPSSSRTGNTVRTEILASFHDSPAIRLLDTIEGVFRKSAGGHILHRRMSLETLVDLGTSSETTDQRDTIYAVLSLASNIAAWSQPDQSDAIIPNYSKNVLDVYVDFILHCCYHSESLDIICRPWAPISSSIAHSTSQDRRSDHLPLKYPSWIASRDDLPFGDPSRRLTHRLHGSPLVGGPQKPAYNAHCGLKPHVSVGRNEVDGTCDGSLYASGIILGEVARRSTRLASAIVTKECLEILGTISRKSHSDLINLPDTVWRTLCADRDDRGQPAPSFYRVAMLHLLQISSKAPNPEQSTNLFEYVSSIDIEELLDTNIPDHVKKYLAVVRNVIWNRRTFQSKVDNDDEVPLVGLIPRNGQVGDQVCILYGCSVPVVLRELPSSDDETCWQLIGDAYVYGVMDGEAVRSSSTQTLKTTETTFKLR